MFRCVCVCVCSLSLLYPLEGQHEKNSQGQLFTCLYIAAFKEMSVQVEHTHFILCNAYFTLVKDYACNNRLKLLYET